MLFALRRWFAASRPPRDAFARGIIALDRGELLVALDAFAVALAEATDDGRRAVIRNKLAVTRVRLGDREGAVGELIAALELDARCVSAIVNVGNLLLEDGDVDEAIVHYEAALRIDERHPSAHINLAVAYRRLGRRGAAVRHLRLANRIDAPSWLRRRKS